MSQFVFAVLLSTFVTSVLAVVGFQHNSIENVTSVTSSIFKLFIKLHAHCIYLYNIVCEDIPFLTVNPAAD